MGCASSTPMIQTTGSEMLKAATHVATDATKNAEDAVQGVKETVGKSLETAKDSVATTVEGVKHEVENVVKEKTEMLEEAKNSLMEKLNLNETAAKTESENVESSLEGATEMAGELNGNMKLETGDSDMMLATTAAATLAGTELEHVLTRTDTETDSLKTSTPEPEIEQALANSKNSNSDNDGEDDNDDDDGHNRPTPKPTLSELENLTAEVIQQQQQHQESIITPTTVNDISMNNDDLLMVTTHENMKSTDDVVTTTAIEPTPATITTATTTSFSSSEQPTNSNPMHKSSPPVMLPLPIATSAIVTATTQTRKETEVKKETVEPRVEQAPTPPQPPPPHKTKKSKPFKREDKVSHNHTTKQISKLSEEKRPGTTEWEKFADMLAQHRKYNPHDAFRRGGTLTKFGGNGVVGNGMRPSYVGHHMRSNGEDDSSDTQSNWRGSPKDPQRSSARAGGRVRRLPNRPNTGNQRKTHYQHHDQNGATRQPGAARRNSNVVTNGRKFDYNPTRSRLNDSILATATAAATVSSNPYSFNQSSLQPALNNLNTQMPYAPYESVKSPSKSRSHHSRPGSRTPHHLEPLERPRSRSQQHQQLEQHNDFSQHSMQSNQYQTGSSMPLQSSTTNKPTHDHDPHHPYRYTESLTRESSNTSLFSNCSYVENLRSFKSTLDLMPLSSTTTNPPLKNTSSFLSTPRCSPFSVRKSYTDLYFSNTSNKENKKQHFTTDLSSVSTQRHLRDKSPYKVRERCEFCSKKYLIK